MAKKRSKRSKEFKDKMRDKTSGEFLNEQLSENGITNKGELLSMKNEAKNNKIK